MPADIRNFFGGKTSTPAKEKEIKKETAPKRRGNKSRKVLDDSEDDDVPQTTKKVTPKKAVPKKAAKKESPEGEETNAADYFASSRSKAPKATPTKSKALETNGRSSARKKTTTSYNEHLDEDELAFLDDDEDAGDDIFAAEAKKAGKGLKNDGYVEIESEEEDMPKPKKSSTNSASASRKKSHDTNMKDIDEFIVPDDEDEDVVMVDEPIKKSRKRKSLELDSDADDSEPRTSKAAKTKSTVAKKSAPKKKAPAKKEVEPETAEMKSIFDRIPTVRPPTPPPKDPDAKPFDWRKGAQGGGNSGPPPLAGSKEIPEGKENCLAGLTFVFTGLLETIAREEGVELVKRYGGRVTGAPSKLTSYVVLGSDAGPSKLKKIADLKIKTINEDGLFELIRLLPANGGSGKAAEKNMEKKRAEEAKIKKEAQEMEKEEKIKAAEAAKAEKAAHERAAAKGGMAPPSAPRKVDSSSLLWTSRYAPTAINQICGNKGAVEKIQSWLKGWHTAHKYNFQKRGADGLGGYRAIIIHGPPGIGKTTAAHLAARLAGFDILESNASDTRSKKLVESGLNQVLDNRSLLGYFAGDGKVVDTEKKKIVLIMDEVDGMSAGDRGGVGALAKVCKQTHIPMILICNDRRLPKMKPFDFVALDIPFRRPTVEQVRSRIATICLREGLKLPMPVIEALIEGSNKDIRQIINMVSTIKLDQAAMDFDKSKTMSKAWEKHVVLKPWDICHKLLGGGMFAPASKATLNDKIELYFNDHEFSYLMVQENYLGTKPILAHSVSLSPREQRLKALQLAEQAAESISDGDLVDKMIHGSQQQWSLMPVHAVFSAVRPASFISGAMTGQTQFTQWLGNNSKYGKLTRYVKEIQSHMRLRSSGDRHEIRQQYLPVLWSRIIKRLEVEEKDCVDEVIELMDSYFLTRDDFDYMLELGLDYQDQDRVHIETQTKAAFTRSYNSRSHPLPFMKASNVVAPAKAVKAAPDLEEAFEEEDEGEVIEEPKADDDDEIDLKKDKYIKAPKPKKAAAKKKTAKKSAKDDDADDVEEEDVRPKKGKGKAAKGKGKK